MEQLYIVCVDDEPEILAAVAESLSNFTSHCRVEIRGSVKEAKLLLDDIDRQGNYLAIVISDHMMPDVTGVEFLTEVQQDRRFVGTKKMLLTGLASHRDTVDAINQARIDRYIEKPWKLDDLTQNVKELLTQYVFEKGLEAQKYQPVLDQAAMLDEIHRRGGI